MLTLNSLRLEIHISEHYAIISSTLHINSKHQSASFLLLIQNFLQLSIFGVQYFDFNLQYLNVGEAREKTFLKTILRMVVEMLLQTPFLLLILTLILTLNLKSKLSTFLPYPLINIRFILCPLRNFLLQFSK